jgi:hypothetical protein
MFVRSRARPLRRTDNLTAICEPILSVYSNIGIFEINNKDRA